MARLIDYNTTPIHYFWGTRGNDRIIGNGTAHIFGGNGDDEINPGINVTGQVLLIYGGVSRAGFGHPDQVTVGQPGSIGGLHNDGNDILHIGRDIWGVGGSGADEYQVHGPVPAGSHQARATLNPFEGDSFIFDHSDKTRGEENGMWVDDAVYSYIVENGQKYVDVKSFTLHGYSTKPGFDQTIEIILKDDLRGVHTPTKIAWSGKTPNDNIREWVYDHSNNLNSDNAGASVYVDDFIF